jgi:hypothetical protein
MSAPSFERSTRSLPDGREITVLTPGRRRGGGDGLERRGVGGAGPRGGPHGHPAIDAIAVQRHATEVSMPDR